MGKIKLILSDILLIVLLASVSKSYCQAKTYHEQFNINIKKNINNVKAINLSEIGTELSYIPLETSPECLIPEISKVEIVDSYIFVNATKSLLLFDIDGKFIRQIGSEGRGPEEYLSVSDFCVDKEQDEIYIISAPKLLIFGFNGVLKESVKLSFRPSQIILKDKKNLMYHLYNVPGRYSMEDSWIITDKKGTILCRYKNSLERTSQPGLIIPRTPLYMYNNTAHFMEFGIDTLYYFQKDQKKPYAIFNFGDLKMDTDPLLTPETLKKISKMLFEKISITSIYENTNYLFLKFFQGLTDSTRCAIYDKINGDLIFIRDNKFINDLDGGIMFRPEQIINDNLLVDYIDAFDLLKIIKEMQSNTSTNKGKNVPTKLSNLNKQLTETSNPVIMVVTSNK